MHHQKRVVYDTFSFGFTVQLWDKKVKRDEDLSDSEDEGEGEGGRRFEKDRGMKTPSKKPSGEASMDISKAPSPTAGSTGLDGAGLGLSLDALPGVSMVGRIGDVVAPSFGGVEPADPGIEASMASTTAMGMELGDAREEDVVEKAAERDIEMAG